MNWIFLISKFTTDEKRIDCIKKNISFYNSVPHTKVYMFMRKDKRNSNFCEKIGEVELIEFNDDKYEQSAGNTRINCIKWIAQFVEIMVFHENDNICISDDRRYINNIDPSSYNDIILPILNTSNNTIFSPAPSYFRIKKNWTEKNGRYFDPIRRCRQVYIAKARTWKRVWNVIKKQSVHVKNALNANIFEDDSMVKCLDINDIQFRLIGKLVTYTCKNVLSHCRNLETTNNYSKLQIYQIRCAIEFLCFKKYGKSYKSNGSYISFNEKNDGYKCHRKIWETIYSPSLPKRNKRKRMFEDSNKLLIAPPLKLSCY